MCGVKTNVITHIEVTDGYLHDIHMFETLILNTKKNFTMKEVYADKGYFSEKNLGIAMRNGVIPFIPFRKTSKKVSSNMLIWKVMFQFFKEHKEEFMKHYHQRSNVESVFSMMKRKFGGYIRSKSDIGRDNEVLCKALCHNICVLIQEMFELGIKIDFQEVTAPEFMCKIEV